MKKIIAIITLLFWSVSVFAQTHTVARGESLQSIAAKYNITETQLIEANPGVDKLFYVGLKLNIPQSLESVSTSTATSIATQTQPATSQTSTSANNATSSNDKNDFDDKPGAAFTIMLEYGFLPKMEGTSGTNYTYAFTAGANYYFMHREAGVFAGARVGYNSANYNALIRNGVGSYTSMTLDSHFISIPINAGYTFANSKRQFAITPYAGIDPNFCVGSKYKQKEISSGSSDKSETKLKNKVGFDARIGAQLRIYGFNIGASYVFPLNDNQKMYFGDDSYLAINIGFGF